MYSERAGGGGPVCDLCDTVDRIEKKAKKRMLEFDGETTGP
jgi:hypothetical protein